MTKEITVFEAGDRVSHALFGKGFAREITRSANGRDMHVYIEFDEPYKRSESAPSTRFRKIVSTYLEKLPWEEVVENDSSVNDIVIDGLEDSGLVKFDFSDNDTDTYDPTPEDELAVSEDDDTLEELDV